MRKIHTLVAIVGISAAGMFAWWYQHRENAPGAEPLAQASPASRGAPAAGGESGPAAVEVGTVETMAIADDAQANGSLKARQGVVLRPEISGRIQQLNFRDGQPVRRGQLLVQLDDSLQRAQLRQAQAQAGIARTQLERSRELLAQGFVSQSAVDQNTATVEVAQAQVALTQAQLARMKIVAPFDGVAGIRFVSVGDYVKDGADLVNIDDIAAVWADFRLPERFSAQVRPGQAVGVAIDALPGRSFEGRVEALDSQVDANGRSLLVRARVDNADGVLRPGMFARARIVFSMRDKALVVPEEALVPQGGKQYLVKLVPGPDGGLVSQRLEARVGTRIAGKVEVLEGLRAGDTVVTAGHGRLLRPEPVPVKVVEIQRAPSPGGAGTPGRAASAAPAV